MNRQNHRWHQVERFAITIIAGFGLSLAVVGGEAMPLAQRDFLRSNCWDCHDSNSHEGEIDLELNELAWQDNESRLLWERVLTVLKRGEMPPKDSSQPSDADRQAMIAWIDKALTAHTPIGGTPPRRLNQSEYELTVRALFGLKDFSLPAGFPVDRELHGFDNLGEGLVLSPPLLLAYTETARLVADQMFPPAEPEPTPVKLTAAADDLVISYSCGKRVDDALRLGMKCQPIQRSCTWPSRIEAEVSGVYSFTVELSRFRPHPDDGPMRVNVFARDVSSADSVNHSGLRLLQAIDVTQESPEQFRFDAELYSGQTAVIHWANANLDSDRDDKADLQAFFERKDREIPGYLAAWNAMVQGEAGQGFRGGIGWQRVKKLLADERLEPLSDEAKAAFLKRVGQNTVLYAETVVFDVFENGPALQIHSLSIDGPKQLVDGPQELERQRLRQRFLGDDTNPENSIRRLLTKAFRRNVDEETVATFVDIYQQHLASGHTSDEAMHLVIRSVLVSPRFLYRCLGDGPLDGYDLATRLSYFLTGGPPDEKLRSKASNGKLLESKILRNEAERLMPKRANATMIENFVGQWLDTRKLADIMPDKQLKFSPKDTTSAKQEAEWFFFEMLQQNRPMTDFIDPDFTWTSARIAKNIYGLKNGFDPKKTNTVHRVDMPRGGRHGGLLGQSAVLMATANGVDTQPVLRGVWVLENVLGTPPPPPPNAVPPITPDTAGAKTPRELLAAHTAESSCAMCHRKIDPVGFVLENFDPVGRWRETWPGIKQPIDSSAVLPDGTEIEDIVDFKAWLVENIDQFSECLSEKLMTHATGRRPNYSERKEIAEMVRRNQARDGGFRDLLLELIESKSFRTK